MPPGPRPIPVSPLTKAGFWNKTPKPTYDRPNAGSYADPLAKPGFWNNPNAQAPFDYTSAYETLKKGFASNSNLFKGLSTKLKSGPAIPKVGQIGNLAASVQNPFQAPYDSIIAQTQANGAQNLSDIDAIKAAIGANYDQATKGLYDQYQNSRNGLDSQANALGVNPNDVYKDYDATLRAIQEQSDQSKAQDQSWTDKMKALRQTQLSNLYTGLATQQQLQMANWQIAEAQRQVALQSAGRSGSKGSGGSSSGKTTTTATDTQTVKDPSYQAAQDMLAGNPLAQSILTDANIAGGSNPTAKQILNLLSANSSGLQKQATTPLLKLTGSTSSAKSPTWTQLQAYLKKQKAGKAALNASAILGGNQGIPTQTQTVVTKGK